MLLKGARCLLISLPYGWGWAFNCDGLEMHRDGAMHVLRQKYEELAEGRAATRKKTIAQKQAAYYENRLGELYTRFTPNGAKDRCAEVGPDQFAQDLLDACSDPRISNYITVIDKDTRVGVLSDMKYRNALFQHFESGSKGHIGEQVESYQDAQLFKEYTTPTSTLFGCMDSCFFSFFLIAFLQRNPISWRTFSLMKFRTFV